MAEVVKVSHGEWYRDEAGGYRFRVVATNGKILSWGESYVEQRDCLAALEALVPPGKPIREGSADR